MVRTVVLFPSQLSACFLSDWAAVWKTLDEIPKCECNPGTLQIKAVELAWDIDLQSQKQTTEITNWALLKKNQ